jgi:sulfite exporter TauE/SafE
MFASLLSTALLLGLAGLGHCAVMCGMPSMGAARACAGAPPARLPWSALWLQLGRLGGYAVLGALAATGMGGVRALSAGSEILRPLWGMAQAACLAVGLWLLVRGRAPTWLDGWSWPLRGALSRLESSRLASWPVPLKAGVVGAGWAALPCGQLYAALSVAALAAVPWQGAGVMLAYALPAAASFASAAAWFGRSRSERASPDEAVPAVAMRGPWTSASAALPRVMPWMMRLSGLGLVAVSVWALVHMFTTQPGAWCAAGG